MMHLAKRSVSGKQGGTAGKSFSPLKLGEFLFNRRTNVQTSFTTTQRYIDRRRSFEFLEAKNQKESFYDISIDIEQIRLLIKDIKNYDDLVKGGDWIKRPCNYNSYGKNTECEYCKMAEIYTGPLSNQPK